eukprot:1186645-Prorocentrum_minimum.AAC.1
MGNQMRLQLLRGVRLCQQPSVSPDPAPRRIPPLHFLQHPQDPRPVYLLQPPTVAHTSRTGRPVAPQPCTPQAPAGTCTRALRPSRTPALSFSKARCGAPTVRFITPSSCGHTPAPRRLTPLLNPTLWEARANLPPGRSRPFGLRPTLGHLHAAPASAAPHARRSGRPPLQGICRGPEKA